MVGINQDETQHRNWTFYEAINQENDGT